MFKPALITSLKHYSFQTFLSDLIAGVIVGIVALPLAIAFAIGISKVSYAYQVSLNASETLSPLPKFSIVL